MVGLDFDWIESSNPRIRTINSIQRRSQTSESKSMVYGWGMCVIVCVWMMVLVSGVCSRVCVWVVESHLLSSLCLWPTFLAKKSLHSTPRVEILHLTNETTTTTIAPYKPDIDYYHFDHILNSDLFLLLGSTPSASACEQNFDRSNPTGREEKRREEKSTNPTPPIQQAHTHERID